MPKKASSAAIVNTQSVEEFPALSVPANMVSMHSQHTTTSIAKIPEDPEDQN